MKYKQDLGCESDVKEYKQFCLCINHLMAYGDNLIEFYRTCYWDFNHIVLYTIKKYFKLYLPKYIASYSHPYSSSSHGEFYIGVDNDGLVHGIPYMGKLNIDFYNILKNIFEKKIKSSFMECKNDYFNKINFKIIEIEKPNKFDKINSNNSIFNDHYLKYLKNMEIQNKIFEKYIRIKRKWEHIFDRYTGKLHELVNDNYFRNELIEFIRENSKKNYDLIADLKCGKVYSQQSFHDIQKIRDDDTNIFYWIIKYKDKKISFLKFIKPKKPKLFYNNFTPLYLISNVPNMIPLWIQNNPELNLFIIKITFPGNIHKDKYLKYLNKIHKNDRIVKEWAETYRTMYDGFSSKKNIFLPRCEPVK